MGKGIHDGHRQRMRERFLNDGLEHFQPHEVLELLLYYAIPRRDTCALAHRLIDHFGTLPAVLDVPVQELMKVEGMTENAAVFLSLYPQLFQRYNQEKFQKQSPVLDSTQKLGAIILPMLSTAVNESVLLICMDGKFKLLDKCILTTGSVNASEITARLILHRALLFNASVVVLAHNHPSGVAIPSRADIDTTIHLVSALTMAEIHLWDHIIVGGNDMVSMRETKSLRHIFNI